MWHIKLASHPGPSAVLRYTLLGTFLCRATATDDTPVVPRHGSLHTESPAALQRPQGTHTTFRCMWDGFSGRPSPPYDGGCSRSGGAVWYTHPATLHSLSATVVLVV